MTGKETSTQRKKAENQIDNLNSEAKALFDKFDYKKAVELSNKAYRLALKQKYPIGTAEALLTRGKLLCMQQENFQAREVFLQAYKIIEVFGGVELLSRVYTGLGITYGQLHLWEESINYLTKAIEASKSMKNDSLIAAGYINLAVTLEKLHNYPQAIDFTNKAMKYAKKLADEQMQIVLLSNLSVLFLDKGDFDTALQHSFDALQIAEKNNEILAIITIYHNISASLMALKRFDEAENYAQLCLSLAKDINVTPKVINIELLRARINLLQEKYDEAKNILQNVENIPAFKGDIEAIYTFYELLLKVYEATVDYKNAYEKLQELMDFDKKQAEENFNTRLETQEMMLRAELTGKGSGEHHCP